MIACVFEPSFSRVRGRIRGDKIAEMEAQNSPAQRFLAALLEWPQLLKVPAEPYLLHLGLSRQSSSNTDLLRNSYPFLARRRFAYHRRNPHRLSSDAVMHVLRQIDETAYKLPSGLQLLSQLCVTATTASSSAVDMDARRGFDRAAQEAVISQLLAQPLRAEELLLSFVEDYPLGAVDVAALPPLALTWRGEPSSLTAFGASVVPLSVIALLGTLLAATPSSSILPRRAAPPVRGRERWWPLGGCKAREPIAASGPVHPLRAG